MASRNKRLAREVADCQKDSSKSGITIRLVHPDSLDKFVGTFPGPQGTPYEGGTYEIEIEAPEGYPFQPLKMRFITKVYHPNVSSQSGFICLDILKTSWSPVFTLRTCLVSLQSLLSTPEPNDPQDAEVAKVYLTSRERFDETARYWAQVYAGAPSSTSPNGASESEGGEDKQGRRAAQLAGIDWGIADELGAPWVVRFAEMGFEPRKVVEVLQLLNYRADNRERVGHEAVLERLFS
ncbi:ubiquitin-conjugating enzyme/RWD-like protein [Leucosporidium creatinivorum]|uniref:Ubiquitin-conjugating enzyme E2 1 n=1 Tax=Leucosporidium creatinivorum TaxID=106004 RepID=A0A1Y2EQL9_9BASI|nr:ubiquitin-conjugating enzyme/RWD-like protein [Leucosporidium creatinivorum]